MLHCQLIWTLLRFLNVNWKITCIRPFLSWLYSLLKCFLLTGKMISDTILKIHCLHLWLFYNLFNFFLIHLFLMKVHLHLMRLFFTLHFSFVDFIKGFFIHGNTSGSIQLFNNGSFFHEMMNFLTKILESFISWWL